VNSLTQDDVLYILKILDESTIDELHLETGDLKLTVRKRSATRGPLEAVDHLPTDPQVPDRREQAASTAAHQEAAATILTPVPEEDRLDEPGLAAIRAPMLGTFYRSPKPGAPPFVEIGQVVTEDDTVCIIEVMKLFNTVKAGLRGRIVKVFPEDGRMVEFNQPLFLVDTAADESPSSEQQAG
jgi:acetyl-CoA carboxylase biotin carboxyl carrier protein